MSAPGVMALSWLLTLLLHSSVALCLAWGLERVLAPRGLRTVGVREWCWRLALWLPLASATLAISERPELRTLPVTQPQLRPQSTSQPAAVELPLPLVVPGSLPSPPRAVPPATADETARSARATAAAAPMSPARAADPGLSLAPEAVRGLLWLWLLPMGGLLLRLAHQWHRVRRDSAALPRVLDPAWLALAATLTPRRPVLLRADPEGRSPLAGPGLQVVLPDWVLALDCPLQRRTLLAHELHHIDRGDPRWRLWHEVLAACLWPQPLLRLAINRLEALAELSCDARATGDRGSAHALARSLLTCADRLRQDLTPAAAAWPRPTALQPAMATSRSPLSQRLHHLLDPTAETIAMHTRSHSGLRTRLLQWTAAALGLIGASLLLPAIAVSQVPSARSAASAAPASAGSPVPMPHAAPTGAALPAGSAVPALRAEPAMAAEMPGAAAMPALAAVSSGASVQLHTSDAGGQRISVQQREDADGTRIQIELGAGRRNLEARFDGKPEFNEAGDTLLSLRGGDTAWIDDQRQSPRRRVDFEQGADGLSLRYRVDGRELALDDAGRRWLAATTLELVRETALGVEPRVARLLSGGGAPAVLDEIERIRASHARGRYLRELAQQVKLSDPEQVRFLTASRQLGSDYERRLALLAMLERHALGPVQQARVLAATNGIESDYEKRLILAQLAARLDLNDAAVRDAWVQTMRDLGSGYERRQAITGLTERADLDAAALAVILDGIAEIGSDYEQRVSLQQLAPRVAHDGALATRYVEATRRIGSDYEQRQALSALLESGSGDGCAASSAAPQSGDCAAAALWPALLDAAGHIGSDYERRVLLVEIAARMPDHAQLIARYRQLAAELSDYERGVAERALLDKVL